MNDLKTVLTLSYFHMRSRYRKTIAGFLWVIANPIINFTVQAIVFKIILKINIENYPAFLLSGLLPWFFISQSVTNLASSLVNAREILLSFKVNPLTIVASQVLDNFVNYVSASFVIMIGLLTFGIIHLDLNQLIFFIVDSILLFFFVYYLTAVISFLHVFYRDVQFVAGFVMNLAFFLTPIFYKREFVEAKYQWIFDLNIFYPIIYLFNNTIHQFQFNTWGIAFLKCLFLILVMYGILNLLLKRKMKDFFVNV